MKFCPLHLSLSQPSTSTFLSCAQAREARGSHTAEDGMNKPPRMDGLLPKLPPKRSHAALSSATFRGDLLQCLLLLESIPARIPGAQARQSFIKASLSSPCFGDIVLWIFPRAQPLFKPSGKTLKSLSLKTKASGAAATAGETGN